MYINNKDQITKEQISQYLKEKAPKIFDSNTDWENESCVDSIFELNESLFHDRSVFVTKEPSGRSNYTIHYVDEKGIVRVFWPGGGFREYFGMKKSKRNHDAGGRYWVFGSQVHGMSWILDATDNVFRILKEMGGCYAQIGSI